MIATKDYIDNLRFYSRLEIDSTLETFILAEFGEEPLPYEWSDQDLHEQVSKVVDRYNQGKIDVNRSLAHNRLQEEHEALRESHRGLHNEHSRLVKVLDERGLGFLRFEEPALEEPAIGHPIF